MAVEAPAGCIVNPSRNAAVGVRGLTAIVLGDLIVGVLSKAWPERALAGCGPHHQIILSGWSQRREKYFLDYETFAGGPGKFRGGTGVQREYRILGEGITRRNGSAFEGGRPPSGGRRPISFRPPATRRSALPTVRPRLRNLINID